MVNSNDCFGILYDQLLTPCRDLCAVRHQCEKQVKEHLRNTGNNSLLLPAKKHVKASGDEGMPPVISPTMSRVIDYCESMGLKATLRRYYVALKDRKDRSMLYCSRLQATRLTKAIRFVRFKKRESFPPEIRSFISHEKCCGHYYFVGEDMDQLKNVISIYIERVQAMLDT
nr:hypothetical protein 8 [bacterium]